MRSLALVAIVLGCGAASSAGAQALSTGGGFTLSNASPAADAASVIALNNAAFAPKSYVASADPIGARIEHQSFEADGSPVVWSTNQVQLAKSADGSSVDSLRVSVGGALRTPGSVAPNARQAAFDAQAYELSVIRDWPSAMKYTGKSFAVDVSPHAGVGVLNGGGSAEAGATVRLMQHHARDDIAKEKLQAMGVADGESLGPQGRFYLFAAASGRAVGMNMMHGEQGWDRGGLTTDATSSLVGDAQAGVGWRKGDVQTSFGYVHREMKGQHMIWGQGTRADSMVAFSLSIRPHF